MPRKPGKLLDNGTPTVREAQAQQVIKLIESGVSQTAACEQVGVTMAALRTAGVLKGRVAQLLGVMAEADLLKAENQATAARARLTELMMQDEKPEVAMRAAAKLIDTGITINNVAIGGVAQMKPETIRALQNIDPKFLEDVEVVDAEEVE